MNTDFSIVRDRRLMIALSGGADSVALTVLLAQARKDYGLTLFAAHLDHGIRPESAEDAAFCRSLCEALGIPFYCRRIDIPREAAQKREGLETLARKRRYEWLRTCKAEASCDYIALAHHMDDQAETLLMHLGRGAGPEGLCGMRELSGDLYRPLLDVRKAELVAFLCERGMSWREDFTNGVDDTPRNALRLHAIPALEQCYPQFVRAVGRYAHSAQIESDYIGELTADYIAAHRAQGPGFVALDVEPAPPRALLRRALKCLSPVDVDWETLNALEALCNQRRGRLSLSAQWHAERTGRRIYYMQKRPAPTETADLLPEGTTALDGICTITATVSAPVPIRDDPMRQVLNAKALRGAVLRTRRDGDRIRPLGSGDKLLSDYLTDQKIDRPLRDRVAVVAVGNRIHWVCGLGISAEAAVCPGDPAIELTCRYDKNNGFLGKNGG